MKTLPHEKQLGTQTGRPARRRRSVRGFTLIELMLVIGIIGILAALLVGSSLYAVRAMRLKRVHTELNQLVLQIEAYKAKLGFYPPDNPGKPADNPLFYELLGLRKQDQNATVFLNGAESITAAAAATAFGSNVFANAVVGANDTDIVSFTTTLKSKQYAASGGVNYLVVPVEGPAGSFNPWRYVSSSPTNNPNSFDLWAEVVVGNKTTVVGNWKN